jgi:hypothetical protein
LAKAGFSLAEKSSFARGQINLPDRLIIFLHGAIGQPAPV